MANPERVVLVDGTALIYRAFFALPSNLMTRSGLHTNAIFGFATMFRKLFAGKTPSYGAVVFDAPGKTFRDEQFPEYKATREKMADELREQLPWIDKLVEVHRFPMLKVPGYEADDVIGTLTKQARDRGFEVHIVSADKDFAQLIDDDTRMVDTMRDVTYDADLVKKKWEVWPHQMIDFLALVGDKIDNVPGVPGIGKVGAARLLDTYGDLDGILANLDALKGRQQQTLTDNRELAILSRDLVTIRTDVPLEVGIEDLKIVEPERSALNALYKELQFYSLIEGAAADALSKAGGDRDHSVVVAPDEVRKALDALAGSDLAALHPVFDDDEQSLSRIVGLAAAPEVGVVYYFPFEGPDKALSEASRAAVAEYLADPEAKKVAHDFKRLWLGLKRVGMGLEGVVFDTRLASFLIDPTRLIPHRLDQLTKEFLQRTVKPAKSVVGSGKKQRRFSEVKVAKVGPWGCHLADAVLEMTPAVNKRLEAEGQTEQLKTHDLPLSLVLGQMEFDGIKVDQEDLAALGREYNEKLSGLEANVHELAGKSFNIASTKQLAEVLFEDLGLPVIKRTKTGYSTNSEVLERLQKEHPIADAVLEWRKIAKLINTYTDVLQASVNPATGRIHATFQQTVGATGRLITTDPDLQRTPIKTPEGKRIRRAFIAEPGCKLISADWSQIELRLLAHFCADERLVEAFVEGRDVHARTASRLFDVPLEEVDYAKRQIGKTVNFATIYGQGATSLAQILGIDRKEAKRYITNYFKIFSGVREWLDATIETALETGHVTTLLGRKRYIPELSSNTIMVRKAGERIAANTPIQGSAADICKMVMLQIPARLRAAGLETKMLLQIHDELLFEAPEDEVDQAAAIIRDAMESVVELKVPLVVDVGVGHSWAEAH